MEIFIVEFTIFSSLYWKNVDYKITATSVGELKQAVINQLELANEDVTIWELIEKDIRKTELVFPIIEERIWTT